MSIFHPLTWFRFLSGSARRPLSERSRRGSKPARVRLTLEALEERSLLSAPGSALGVAGSFNVFVLGGLTQSYTDAGGRVAAGGNVSLTGYGVGSALTNSAGTRDDLVVGASLTFNQGQVFNGNIVYGGTAALSNVGLPNGTARQGAPVDFGAAGSQLAALSAAWAALAPNGTTANNYGTLNLTGTDPALDIFAVTSGQLAGANGLNINAPAGATVLVNVSGTAGQMQYFGMNVSGTDKQHVLFNFPGATTLTLAGISVQGSVLAPQADVTFNNGNLEGTLAAHSLTGSGEFHYFPTLAQVNVPAPTPPPTPPPAPAPAGLSGIVFVDANNDGVRQTGEAGVAGVTVTLSGKDASGHTVSQTVTTQSDGSYQFTGLAAGNYTLTAATPTTYGVGKSAAGTAGGTPAGGQVGGISLGAGVTGSGYTFGVLPLGGLSGYVYVDANNDGIKQSTEAGLGGVAVTLTGTNDLGQSVTLTATTTTTGAYGFTGLRPGSYFLTETQPAAYLPGKATIGSQGGTATTGKFQVTLGVGVQGVNNNFGELTPPGTPLTKGQTATIGFWQGPNGQALINSFGTTAAGQTLAGWLSTTLPGLYGPGGVHDLTGRSDAYVASLFQTLFAVQGQKVEAQILAAALAVFTTTNALDTGATSRALAVKDGFLLSDAGTGAALWNVGTSNTAFGVAANTSLSVLDLLRRTDSQVAKGKLFGGSATLINQANTAFSGINQGGDI